MGWPIVWPIRPLPHKQQNKILKFLWYFVYFIAGTCQAIELRDGVYYPMGGFGKVGEGLAKVCRDLGVEFRFDCPVSEVSLIRIDSIHSKFPVFLAVLLFIITFCT